MANELRKTYFLLITPAVILTVVVYLLLHYNIWEGVNFTPSRTFSVVYFVLAIAVGVALPIFLRVFFFSKLKEKNFTTPEEFTAYQKQIIKVVSITAYMAFGAALVKMESFYFGGTVLAAIYALYYHYPSDKKIRFDKKIFKVKTEEDGKG